MSTSTPMLQTADPSLVLMPSCMTVLCLDSGEKTPKGRKPPTEAPPPLPGEIKVVGAYGML